MDTRGYDLIVATSQKAINDALGVFVEGLQKNIGLFYSLENESFIKVPDEKNALFIFKGKISYDGGKDKSGQQIIKEAVSLYTEASPTKVSYNVYFQDGNFTYNLYDPYTGKKITHSIIQGKDEWCFSFITNLDFQNADFNKLPEDIKQKLKNIGEDIFSLKQLYIDLNSADLSSLSWKDEDWKKIQDVPRSALKQMLEQYVKDIRSEHGELFLGQIIQADHSKVMLMATNKGVSLAEFSFIPTDFTFYVSRYSNNGQFNPQLDTLNYLVMTQNHYLPSDVPDRNKGGFNINFVENENQEGKMIVSYNTFHNKVLNFLLPITNTLCKDLQGIRLITKGAPLLPKGGIDFDNIINKPYIINENKLECTFNHKCAGEKQYYVKGDYKYASYIKVEYSDQNTPAINLISDTNLYSGCSEVDGQPEVNTSYAYNGTRGWNCKLDLVVRENQVKVNMNKFNFDDQFIDHTERHWYDFLSGNTITELNDDVKTTLNNIHSTIEKTLSDTFQDINLAVLPGAKQFIFKNPGFIESEVFSVELSYNKEFGSKELVGDSSIMSHDEL